MVVEGGEAEVRAVLESTGITGTLRFKSAGAGRVSVEAEADEEAKERIFYAFAQAKMMIREMRSEKITLEEIFLEYTGLGKGEAHDRNL